MRKTRYLLLAFSVVTILLASGWGYISFQSKTVRTVDDVNVASWVSEVPSEVKENAREDDANTSSAGSWKRAPFVSVTLEYPIVWDDSGRYEEALYLFPAKNIGSYLQKGAVVVYHHTPTLCESGSMSCGDAPRVPAAPDAYFDALTANIQSEPDYYPESHWLWIPGLDTRALVYRITDERRAPGKAYIFIAGEDVYRVSFIRDDLLGEEFIEEFMDRIDYLEVPAS